MSWPDHRSVFYALGTFLSGLAALMLLPALADLVVADSNWTAFLASATVTGGVGGATILAFRTKHKPTIGRREGFLLITLSWVVSCIFAALPFMLSRERLGFADAFFESTSGLTTTGSTILADLEAESHGVLLWRALLHWVGGVGIIVIAPAGGESEGEHGDERRRDGRDSRTGGAVHGAWSTPENGVPDRGTGRCGCVPYRRSP